MNLIRNFCILAHVDHGKSTLADRFLELTGTIEKRKMRAQYLDMHPLEREKGITIKMQPVRMRWKNFILNLIDTPGHVDFSYEVSRALAAVEGAILLVDATQGIQAQTVANLALARGQNLVVIPAVNKIDLPSADPSRVGEELKELVGADEKIFYVSAKEGTGVEDMLHAVVEKIPPPDKAGRRRAGSVPGELRALVFDSQYDAYHGVLAHVRVVEGGVKKDDSLLFLATGAAASALEVGVFKPERIPSPMLGEGEIGYIATGIKEPAMVRAGDTIVHADIVKSLSIGRMAAAVLPGYEEVRPLVFASFFPENQSHYEMLRDALSKLRLEDSAFSFEPESAAALGRGFRVGFLGLLHMEIIYERIRREYEIPVVLSTPSVGFRILTKEGRYEHIYRASALEETRDRGVIEEPWARLEIITPALYLGSVAALLADYQGALQDTVSLSRERLFLRAEAPLRGIIIDFYDRLKSISHGFASLAYEFFEYRPGDLVKVAILIAGEDVPAFAEIVSRRDAGRIGRSRVQRLKELLARSLFPIALQAEVEGRIIARETIPAQRKDVTGYLYGGDRTRKMKLWKKQQRGKKLLKARGAGSVNIPPDVFLKMLKK